MVHIVITGQFNFAIGGDGTIYELNGFDSVAKHANFYDNISLGMYIIIRQCRRSIFLDVFSISSL